MITRLAINLSEEEEDFVAVASRIREVVLVDITEDPDAIITDDNGIHCNKKPTLLYNTALIKEEPWLFPAFPARFSQDIATVHKSCDTGKLGQLGLMRMHVWAHNSTQNGNASKISAADLALWFFGQEPEVVYGTSQSSGSASCSLLHLGFKCGGMALIDFTNSLPEGEGYQSLCLIGSEGAAYADDHRNRNLFFGGGAPGASCPDMRHSFVRPMLENFIATVRHGATSELAVESYRRAIDIVSKANHSTSP